MFKPARVMIALSGLLVLSLPAFAQDSYGQDHYGQDHYGQDYYGHHGRHYESYGGDGEFRFRVGDFRPDGSSDYWNGVRHDFTGASQSDFDNADFGLDYVLPINEWVGVIFSGSYYQGSATQAYRDFEDNFGQRIRHDTNLDIGSATVGILVNLAGRHAPIRPYIGVGGGAYPWRLEERGDFVDFSNSTLPVFSSRLSSSGTAFGYYGLIGLDVPVSHRVSLFAEGRWTSVKADLKDDFDGFGKIDLGGREIAAGIAWKL